MTGIASLNGAGTIDVEDNLDGTGFTYTAGTFTDGTMSVTAGVFTGIASLNGAGTIDLEDNLDGTGFTVTAGTFTDGTWSSTGGAFTGVASIVIADGGTVGQAAGPLLTFDDSNNYCCWQTNNCRKKPILPLLGRQ